MRKLTAQQKRVIDDDDIAWEGWDAKNRPVVGAWFHAGHRQPMGNIADRPGVPRRNAESKYERWALLKSGDAAEVSEPVTGIE